jgi:dTDP-4-dehydrorhamnose reductase
MEVGMAALNRAIVTGGSGLLGRALLSRLGDRGVGTCHSRVQEGMVRFDARTQSLHDVAKELPADTTHVFIAHAVANPEICVSSPAETASINSDGAIRLVQDARALGLVPIFLSSDYVFSGDRGSYTETDDLSPITEYGRQKAKVESWMKTLDGPWLVCRLSKVVSQEMDSNGVLDGWAKDILSGRDLRCATDQIFSPASIEDVVDAMLGLVEKQMTGLFNVAGEAMSRYALAETFVSEIQRVAPSVNARLIPCKLSDIRFKEVRPLNTSLDVSKARDSLGWKPTPMPAYISEFARQRFAMAG